MTSLADKTAVLVEALPYIQRYERTTFVVKYGGAAMTDDGLKETFAQDVTLLKKIGVRMVIVHGGGRDITDLAGKLGLESRFVEGVRYTDPPMMGVVQMVLGGRTNQDIVARINRHDGGAVGLTGVDHSLLRVRRSEGTDGADLGLVGEVEKVDVAFLAGLLDQDVLPVIAPLGVDAEGRMHNVNADTAAGAIAEALKARKLVYLSDIPGVMADGELLPSLDRARATELVQTGVIDGGMLPKLRSAFAALDAGVRKVHIIDGRVQHSLLLEIFTREGVGTEIVP
ncbi:MAG TPA: acetylglutamate kinase [Candidatus Krumholzibacteria bacterium]|nr:acetylglutamate kinase [Candidatus Krumholzibacteria bacterium]